MATTIDQIIDGRPRTTNTNSGFALWGLTITATARKLAIIIWNMIVKKEEYAPNNPYEFLDQKRKRIVRELQKKIAKFVIKTDEIHFSTC
ncbi:MAG: hypothetical protein HYR91_09875 [Flavobacteriia bacterium]|nr:hypothetical protein [Flavobacteriia bacterium]